MPHVGIAERLQVLWDDNDGNSIARLIKLVPKKPELLKQTAYGLVSDIAENKGLDGEAQRLRALHGNSTATFGWQCDVCKSRIDSWHSHCPSCGQLAGLRWQQPEKVTPLLSD